MDWTPTVRLSRLQREQRCIWPLGDNEVLLLWYAESVYAFENRCPHQGFALENSVLDAAEHSLSCPLHQWRFRLGTGQCLHNQSALKVYETRLQDQRVWIRLPGG
ncbi:MAG: Rieske (2Fe-2S) protein [Candidatus Sericytochromatia bacterium]|nr:Rieske (2Fe-2S) protein [Candidatus Sericytochromatia bacterium]